MFYLHNHGKFQGGRNHAMISIVMISSTLAPQSLLETAARVIHEVLNLMLTFLDLQSSQAHLTSLRATVSALGLHDLACCPLPKLSLADPGTSLRFSGSCIRISGEEGCGICILAILGPRSHEQMGRETE